MVWFKNDLHRLQGLRIEEESRRRDEETEQRLAHSQPSDMPPRRSLLGDFVATIRRAVRR